jgi:lysophospholipase L1-like esterase
MKMLAALILFSAMPARAATSLRIAWPERKVAAYPAVATLDVHDNKPSLDPGGVSGTHTGVFRIPYIQTSADLAVSVECTACDNEAVVFTLAGQKGLSRQLSAAANAGHAAVTFASLPKDEYVLDVQVGAFHDRATRIGIGDILTAIGDSLTEGFYGNAAKGASNLTIQDWTQAPAATVSKDGRNFPQFGPRGDIAIFPYHYKQGWMTELNDDLSQRLQYPVFIVNEGYGGYTSADYLGYMGTDGWKERESALKPNRWLIHLGVNEAIAQVPPASFIASLTAVVKQLQSNYGARPEQIFIARPSYINLPGQPAAEAILPSYIQQLDVLCANLGMSHGPDFQAFFAQTFATYYFQPKKSIFDRGSADMVHPNAAGQTQVARLWADALAGTAKLADSEGNAIGN